MMQGDQPPLQRPSTFDRTGRDVLCFFCIAALFFSVFDAAFCVLMAVHYLDDDIQSGVVHSMGRVKSGYRLTFEDGREATFRYGVLYAPPNPITLAIGDRIAKARGTITYWVNGRAITDRDWFVHTVLLPTDCLVFFASYGVLGGAYAMLYRRTPVADLFRGPKRDRPPATLRRLSTALLSLIASWLLLAGSVFVFFGYVTYGLGGAIKQIFHGD